MTKNTILLSPLQRIKVFLLFVICETTLAFQNSPFILSSQRLVLSPTDGCDRERSNPRRTYCSPLEEERHLSRSGVRQASDASRRVGTSLHLAPISQFDDDIHFLSSPESYRLCIGENGELRPSFSPAADEDNNNSDRNVYSLHIAEEDDLPGISQLTIDAFGAAVVTLSGELNDFEKALIGPTVGMWNAYTDSFAYVEVLSGLRSRMGQRLQIADVSPPPISSVSGEESHATAAGSSVVLVLSASKQGSDGTLMAEDPIATVELRLQPTDAKIPFSQPWLDKIERKAAIKLGIDSLPKDKRLQPYLSNLCVAENARGRKIGKALCRCVESIAKNTWGYSKIYLHVDLENDAAYNLYKSEGYRDVGSRWNPFWAGGAAEIGYFVKNS